MKFTYILWALLFINGSLFAQNNMGSSNDEARIAIAPVIHNESGEIPIGAQKMIVNKMRQAISLNGLSALDDAPLFIIFPQISIIDEQVTSSVPPMYTNQIDVSLVIADQYTGNVFNTVSYQLKGAGKSTEQAYMQALRRINPRDGKIKAFIAKGKESIIEYYNTHCDLLISRAQSLAAQNQYCDALALLNSTPPVCRECFDKANAVAIEIGKEIPPGFCNKEEKIETNDENKQEYTANSEINMGSGLFIRFKHAETVGEQTQINLEIINKGENDVDFSFSRIWSTLLIDEKGHEHNLKEFYQASKRNHYQSKVILGTPCPVTFVFDKVNSIRFLTFTYNRNTFKFRDIPLN